MLRELDTRRLCLVENRRSTQETGMRTVTNIVYSTFIHNEIIVQDSQDVRAGRRDAAERPGTSRSEGFDNFHRKFPVLRRVVVIDGEDIQALARAVTVGEAVKFDIVRVDIPAGQRVLWRYGP